MRIGIGDIVPLNIPPGAVTQGPQSQQAGWYKGADGNWHWTGKNPPNLNIPITTGPGITPNSGWAQTPNGTLVWTGPGNPGILPPSFTPPGTAPLIPPSAQGPLQNWTPQPVLPDSVLPAPLQRSNPLLTPAQWVPNRFDFQIIGRARKWEWIAKHGGLKTCCRIPELGAPIYDVDPNIEMPTGGYEFNDMNGLPIADFQDPMTGLFTGLDVLILSIEVPSGYDGVINRFVASVTNMTGYNDFTGDIVWRLKYGIRYAKNLGDIDNTYGSFHNAIQVPGRNIARVISGQTIQLYANVPVGSPVSGGTINAGVFGWFYPRR